jgi:bifunctional DNase/RNase
MAFNGRRQMKAKLPAEILGLYVEPQSGSSVVLLGEHGETSRVVPVFIGPAEAQAIAIGLEGLSPPRPLTHDLIINIMADLKAQLVRVDITELRDGAFLAELELLAPDGTHRISARPSDGMALAVRLKIPIFVDRSVFDEAGVEISPAEGERFNEEEIDEIVSQFQSFLSTAEAADFALDDDQPEDEQPDDGAANKGP